MAGDYVIERDIAASAQREFDLVIIGGGIQGVSLLHEAARHGLAACLCEARDFGGGTSWNSLRIVHGGLRYLQSIDLRRFSQSVAARRHLVRQFPTLLRPLGCLMPLYGDGLRRMAVMRAALAVNDLLSNGRNLGVPGAVHLPRGGVLGPEEVMRRSPWIRRERLDGGARWSDYFMVSSERIVMELLLDACRQGASALNYAPVTEIVIDGGRARGVELRDSATGARQLIAARAVFNCTGPRLRGFAGVGSGDSDRLFRPSLAFNLLLDKPLGTDDALAVAAPRPGAPVMFLVPQRESCLAGTMHLARPLDTVEAQPTEAEVAAFISQLNQALPSLGVRLANVRRVFAGLLPAAESGTSRLARRDLVVDHGSGGGPKGLFSLSGVKFTTARDVARQALAKLGCRTVDGDEQYPLQLAPWTTMALDSARFMAADDDAAASALASVIRQESVLCEDDLVLRRTNWATTDLDLDRLRARVKQLAALPAGIPMSRRPDLHN